MKRTPPGPDQFLPIGAGETLSSTFYLSHAYDVTKAGTYSIAMDTYLDIYVEGSVIGKPDIQTNIAHLFSSAVSFQLVLTRKKPWDKELASLKEEIDLLETIFRRGHLGSGFIKNVVQF